MGRVSAPSAIGRKRTKYLLAQHAAGATSVRDLLARAYDTGVKDVGQVLAAQSATTTGADLLEQAALVEEWKREKRDWHGNTSLIDRTIRALSARNLTDDGGGV
ncbi:hypothetical protein [Sphingomonas sp. UBA978]|uniref:hypothetical protein n=1 Tax=Sphingomonas sp. UBA978 TaxID=1947536 RepID=UPI0025E36D00|nr:hypothetical protein [Sphingomonas sp. UBA978]